MFDVRSDEYEAILTDSLQFLVRQSVLSTIISIGGSSSNAAQSHVKYRSSVPIATNKGSAKKAFSTTVTSVLATCKAIEARFREKARALTSVVVPLLGAGEGCVTVERSEKMQTVAAANDAVRSLSANDCLSPEEKLEIVNQKIGGILFSGRPAVAWEAITELLSLKGAVTRLMHDDVSIDVALLECDAAIAYAAQRRFEIADQHAESCRSILKVRAECHSDEQQLHKLLLARCYFVSACCSIVEGKPERSRKYSTRAFERMSLLAEGNSARMFPFALLRQCSEALCGDGDSSSLETLATTAHRYAATSFSKHCSVLLVAMFPHVSLLCQADRELRSPAVRDAKEKLLVQVAAAGNKKELEAVHQELLAVVSKLEQKSTSLQHCIIRQVNATEALFTQFVTSHVKPRDVSLSANSLRDLLIASLSSFRIFAAGSRRGHCRLLSNFLSEGIRVVFPTAVHTEFLLEVCRVLSGSNDQLRYELSAFTIREMCGKIDEATSTPAVVALTDVLQVAMSAITASRVDEVDIDLDEACSFGEVAVAHLFGGEWKHNSFELGSRQLAGLRSLQQLYHVQHNTTSEIRCAALQAAVSAELYGPTHAVTNACIVSFGHLQRRVHAPTFNPCWGVHPLLTPVSLACDTPDAKIFFTIGNETPVEDVGVNNSSPYAGPIYLDRLGPVVIRAFSSKDGNRSGVVEARYTVQRR